MLLVPLSKSGSTVNLSPLAGSVPLSSIFALMLLSSFFAENPNLGLPNVLGLQVISVIFMVSEPKITMLIS